MTRRTPSRRPKPGQPVRGSTSGRPIMAAFDLLGRRWVLRVIWELQDEPLSFRALRERCDELSPSVLAARVAELREAGIVELGPDGYALTKPGRKLVESLQPLLAWSRTWAKTASRPSPTPKR